MRGLQLSHINLIGGQRHVQEDRDKPVLEDGVDGGGKACGDGDDLVAGLQSARAKLGRGQRGERNQVRRRAGVDQRSGAHTDEAGELALKLLRPAAGGEPAVQSGVHHGTHIGGVDDLTRDGDGGGSGNEVAARKGLSVELSGKLKDLLTKVVGPLTHR